MSSPTSVRSPGSPGSAVAERAARGGGGAPQHTAEPAQEKKKTPAAESERGAGMASQLKEYADAASLQARRRRRHPPNQAARDVA